MRRLSLVLFWLLLPILSSAEIRPVAPTDNLQAVLRTGRPGDVFLLADGTYAGGVYIDAVNGTRELPITVRAANAGKAVIAGSSATRKDTFTLYRSHNWTLEGLRFEYAGRAGIYIASSDYATVRNCVSRLNGVQGMLTGGANFGTVEDSEFYLSGEQHGIYISMKVRGWQIRRCKMYANAKAGIQFNGSGGQITDCLVEDCRIWGNGATGAAGINCLSLSNSRLINNTIHDNLASGIAMTAGSTGNVVYGNLITFRYKEGRACISASDDEPTLNTVAANICRMGKPLSPAIAAYNLARLVEVDNTILPPAKAAPVPDDPTDTPTNGGGV